MMVKGCCKKSLHFVEIAVNCRRQPKESLRPMTKHPLVQYRYDHCLTQTQLANKLGVSLASISLWENGLRRPQEAALRVITRKLGIPADQLRPDLGRLFNKEGS
jgi:DNA-binding transcriptional regulator YiaG